MSCFTVFGVNALEAWRSGANVICLNSGSVNNLITTIESPCELEGAWLTDRSPHRFMDGANNIRNVVNTIFPLRLANRISDRGGLYDAYLSRHDRAHNWRRGRHAWGTYFERLIRFPPDGVNQLERVIDKLHKWRVRSTTGLVFHLSSPTVDAPRTRGGPCWHYGQLLWHADQSIDFVVAYRNHDFFNKALGNFLALGQLLQFICIHSSKTPGKLICHSVHAYYESSRRMMENLVA